MSILSQLKEKVTQYLNVYIKLLRVNFIGRTANIFSFFFFALICLFIFFCIILYVGFGLTEVFADAGLSKTASFFIVTGIYCLLLVLVIALRKPITRFFSSRFIRVLTEGDEDEEKEDQ